jgi:hypothetical protein
VILFDLRRAARVIVRPNALSVVISKVSFSHNSALSALCGVRSAPENGFPRHWTAIKLHFIVIALDCYELERMHAAYLPYIMRHTPCRMRPSEMMLTNNKNAFLLLSQKSDLQYFFLFLVL